MATRSTDRRIKRKCIVAEGAACAFVAIAPRLGNLTLWVKTDLCVAFVACPLCGSKRGELCGRMGTTSATHWPRRRAFSGRKQAHR